MSRKNTGLTLIELLIIIVIIGILANIVMVRLKKLIITAKESTNKGNLGVIRSGLNIYFSDYTYYPLGDLKTSLTLQRYKYLNKFPSIHIPDIHSETQSVVYRDFEATSDDTGKWGYNNNENSKYFGEFWIDCIHKDSKDNIWSLY